MSEHITVRGDTLALPAPRGQGKCVTCRFWAELPGQDRRRDRRHGQCRRYPPRDRASGAGSLWPVMQGRQWCGEHSTDPYREADDE